MTAPFDSPRPATEIVLRVADGDWFDEDPRWLAQRMALFTELGNAPDTSVRPLDRGGRGAAEEIIVALGSAGAFSSMITIFRAWLGGRPRRSITMTAKNGKSSCVIDFKNLSEAESARWLERFTSGDLGERP
jgi:hypothetical protein